MGHWDKKVFLSLEKILPLKVKSIHYEPLADYHAEWIINGYLRKNFIFGKNFYKNIIQSLFNITITVVCKNWFKKIYSRPYNSC